LEAPYDISKEELILIGSLFFGLISIGFYALFLVFKKRIEREQEALRTAEINFERQISEASMKAEQQERVQIAMDLHDEIGALVTVLKINMLNAQNRVNQPERLFDLLTDTSQIIEKTAETIRTISNRISPPTLVKMGIDTTIEELVKTINTTGKMNIIYKSNLNRMRFNLEAELNIYRVIKETINNILKHSHTKELHIEIKNACDIIKITFNYIGLGLNNAQVEHLLRSEKGSGLKSIQSRINNLRATINYEVDKKGTAEIRIKIPADEIRN